MAEAQPAEPLKPYERKVGNWVRAYFEYTKESESPDNYHIWAGLSNIAASVRRNVWLDQGLYVLFPNLYVAFIGPPARTAKSTALWLSRGIISKIPGIKLGPSAATREQLIRALAESKFDNQCAMTLHTSELSSLIDSSGTLMIKLLMDLYDGNYVDEEGWRYETKHQGKDKVINPFVNIIFGTTPSYWAESMPESLIGHGFVSRSIIIYEEKERHTNSLPDPNDSALAQALVADLTHISRLRGQFKWGGAMTERTSKAGRQLTEAEVTYDNYYQSLYRNVPTDHRLEGFHWRKKTHVLKVAMLLSLAERDDLTITSNDITAAVQFLQDLEPSMARAFSAVGRNEFASVIERIGTQIQMKGEMTSDEIFSLHYSTGQSYELDNVMQTLERMGSVIKSTGMRDGKIITTYKPNSKKALPWQVPAKRKTEGEPGEPDHLNRRSDDAG